MLDSKLWCTEYCPISSPSLAMTGGVWMVLLSVISIALVLLKKRIFVTGFRR